MSLLRNMKEDFDWPLVTVIIPCYNGEEFLEGAIESVLDQSYAQIEVIIVDDGSTDCSPEVYKRYVDETKNIHLFRKSNGGLSSARNAGIRLAKGCYVAFLDCDDIWHREKLSKHVLHFLDDAEKCRVENLDPLGVSYSATRFIDVAGRRLAHSRHPKTRNLNDYYLYCRNPITNGSNAVFRKDVFTDLYFDESLPMNQDVDCWLRISFGGKRKWRLEGLDDELTYYRVNRAGLSADCDRHFECSQRTWEKSFSYAPEVAERYAGLAEAFQLRFYARRSIASGDFRSARGYLRSAIQKNPKICVKEPIETLATFVAAFLNLRI